MIKSSRILHQIFIFVNKAAQKAFVWIIGILHQLNTPFQISGGLAARAYGSTRELNDIDIEVEDQSIAKIAPLMEQYITYGPARYQDENFDLLMVSLNYEGQDIDISGCDTDKIFNQGTQAWEACGNTLAMAVSTEIFGITVPVISRAALIDYKGKIQRETDLEDVRAMQR
jgi:hypothetical protein